MSAREQLDQLDVVAGKAHTEVAALCAGDKQWTMSIPARPDYDSDLVIDPANEAVHTLTGALRSVLNLADQLDNDGQGYAAEANGLDQTNPRRGQLLARALGKKSAAVSIRTVITEALQ